MPAYPLVAFSGGVLVNLLGESNFWDWVRKKWDIPNLRKLYLAGKISRQQFMDEEYRHWKDRGLTKKVLVKAIKKDLKLARGAKITFAGLKKEGTKVAIVSGSSDVLVKHVAHLLRPDYVSYNTIVFDPSGFPYSTKPTHPTPDIRMDKRAALADFAKRAGLRPKQCAIVVHQQEDAEWCKDVAFSVAFNPLDDEIPRHTSVTVRASSLTAVLKHLR